MHEATYLGKDWKSSSVKISFWTAFSIYRRQDRQKPHRFKHCGTQYQVERPTDSVPDNEFQTQWLKTLNVFPILPSVNKEWPVEFKKQRVSLTYTDEGKEGRRVTMPVLLKSTSVQWKCFRMKNNCRLPTIVILRKANLASEQLSAVVL